MKGMVFNIQRFSLFDGPGVRTVVFLKGCPLRCLWCHNPEGYTIKSQIMFHATGCIGCGACVDACEENRHVMRDGYHIYDRTGCKNCGACADVCCTGALRLVGKEMETADVLRTVLRDQPIYQENGGGLTVSGGEPFLQADYTIELLRCAKQEGLHTCVETSGYGDKEKLREAASYIDIFLYDYKATGNEMHRRLCGVMQDKILDNLMMLDELGAIVVLRCPIIPELNETEDHIKGIAQTALEHASIKEIQLEPYHRMGISKSEQLGVEAMYDGTAPVKGKMEEYCNIIRAISGKNTSIS